MPKPRCGITLNPAKEDQGTYGCGEPLLQDANEYWVEEVGEFWVEQINDSRVLHAQCGLDRNYELA